MNQSYRKYVVHLTCWLIFIGWTSATNAETPHDPTHIGSIGGIPLTMNEYNHALSEAKRDRFYHGSVPEGELQMFREEILNKLIDHRLIGEEARRQGMKPDDAWVESKLEGYEARFSGRQDWADRRDAVLAVVRQSLEHAQLADQMERKVKDIPQPDDNALLSYYEANLEKFKSPASDHLWVILLKVPPYESRAAWEAAQSKALMIKADILQGGRFESWAELESDDPSADVGGDLGIRHIGVLADEAQKALEAVEVGELTEPVRLLEGYGLFRRTAHIAPEQHPLGDVRQRAMALLEREMQHNAWISFMKNLRDNAEIVLYGPHALQGGS